METVNEVLEKLAAEGIRLSVQAGELNCYAPKGALTPVLREAIGRHRANIIRLLQERERRSQDVARPSGNVPEFALSAGQKGLSILQKLHPGMSAYNVPLAFRIEGGLDVGLLTKAWEAVLEQYPILTARIVEREGIPYQRLDHKSAIRQERIEPITEEHLHVLLKERGKRPFAPNEGLARIELFTWDGGGAAVLITIHHLVFDGSSAMILLKSILEYYQHAAEGRPPGISRQLPGYQEFVAWEEAMLASPEGAAHAAYWRKQLEGELPVFELLPETQGVATASFEGRMFTGSIPDDLSRWVRDFGRAHTLPASVVFLALFQMVLRKYAEQDEIIFGMPVMGRVQQRFARDIGYFVNMVPLRTRCEPGLKASDFFRRVQATMLDGLFHSSYPFPLMMESLRVKEVRKAPVFQVTYAYQNFMKPDGLGPPAPRQALEAVFLDEIAQEGESDLGLEVFEDGPSSFRVKLKYNPQLYSAQLIARIFDSYCAVLRAVSEDCHRPLDDYAILSEAERRRVLVEFNDTRADFPSGQCLHELFTAQVPRHANEVAAICGRERLTYQELYQRSHDLARYLQWLGVRPDTFVGVCMERSLDMLVAILGTLIAGGAYVPLDPDYPGERLGFTLEDSQAAVVLTQQTLRDTVRSLVRGGTTVVAVDGQRAAIEERVAVLKADGVPLAEDVTPRHLSHVIYTSGSTGKPKGVAIEHHSPVTLVHWALEVFSKEELTRVLASTSICFDLSVYEMFVTLASGGTIILVRSALALPDDPNRDSVTLINTVPSAMEELVRMGAIPGSVLTINLAGEPLSPRLVDKIYDSSTVRKVYDLYGPSEDTTYSTFALRRKNGPQTIGRPIANTRVYILDAKRQLQPAGVPGELFLAGDGLARGYLNREELTREKFVANPFEPGGRMYVTGDRARWNEDGTLQYLGRVDTQVKIRGFRVEIGEIEVRLAEHPGVQDCAVVAQGEGAGRQLVGFYRAKETAPDHVVVLPPKDLKAHLARGLPEHMIPAAFVSLTAIPLNANGKIDRRTLAKMDATITSEQTYVAPRNETEKELVGLFGDVLKREAGTIGVDDDFFELGGHSLVATQLISKIRSRFGVELPLKSIFERSSVAELGELIAKAERSEIPPITRIERSRWERLPLSHAEERVWFMNQLGPGHGTVYSVPAAFIVHGVLDLDHVDAAFELIIARHESLRTIFPVHDGLPERLVLDRMAFRFRRWDLTRGDEETRTARSKEICEADAAIPFDLTKGPLIRGHVIMLAADRNILMVNMHHVISDGWSIGVFVKEFRAIMDALRQGRRPELPDLPIQYADYAVWQRQLLEENGSVLKRQLAYWKRKLEGMPESLDLATDFPRPVVPASDGKTRLFTMDAQLTADLKRLAERQGATLFMVLLTAYEVLLHRYSGQDDICLGTPIANRNYAETEGLIGMFVNTLALRTRIAEDDTFATLLAKVKTTCLEAYEHQDAPFAKIVEMLQPARNSAISPLYQQMFILQSADMGTLDYRTQRYFMDTGVAKYEMTLELVETPDGLDGSLEYSSVLFTPERIGRVIEHYVAMCRAITGDPDGRLGDLDYLAKGEAEQLLVGYNATQVPYPAGTCIHERFLEQVARRSSHTAVVCGDESLSYGELHERSSELALALQAEGVEPDTLVGLFMERSVDLAVGMMGILQAGGAYVPLDVDYPTDRLAYMLEDCGARIVLTQERLRDRLAPLVRGDVKLVAVDREWAEVRESARGRALKAGTGPRSLAYVIYTSGSTGRPKGVLVEHRSVVRLVVNTNYIDIRPDDVFLQLSSPSFDAATFEIWAPLLNGARLAIAPPGLDAISRMGELIRTHGVTVLWLTSGLFQLSVTENVEALAPVRVVLTGGDVVPVAHASRFLERCPDTTLIDGYGPTENTTFTCCYVVPRPLDETVDAIPIGRPIANTHVYILDAYGRPQPIGMPGELHIGGDGLARGYLNDEVLTREKFVADPFRPGQVMYKSGDLARWREGGVVEFLGRVDTQLKIRGFRIETGEIETRLDERADIRESAVVAQGEKGDRRLVAFYVPREAGRTVPAEQLAHHLQQTLPAFMVPAAFVGLDAMPLTSNGKVDRRALERMDAVAESGEEYVAARSEMERDLVGIWAEILNLAPERIGVFDNFFALGGHSLASVQLISRIKRRFNRALPLTAIFSGPTIAAFASLLASDDATASQILVPIQAVGVARPVFGIPGAGGFVHSLQPLTRALGAKRPFYGLQESALDGAKPHGSVGEAASANIAAVKRLQAVGPYSFIGHSYGGVVAFEMTRMLLERGEEVASLTLLDSVAPWVVQQEAPRDETADLYMAYAAIANAQGANGGLDPEKLREAEQRADREYVVNLLIESGFEIDDEQFAAFRAVYRANVACYRAYEPAALPRDVDVSLYRATGNGSEVTKLPEDYGWNRLLRGPIRVHDVDADHYSILEQVRFPRPEA